MPPTRPLPETSAREKLLDNFDQEVIEKVRDQSKDALDRFNGQLWGVTRHVLADYANFDDTPGARCFTLHRNPFPKDTIHPGPYRLGKAAEGDADTNVYEMYTTDKMGQETKMMEITYKRVK